MHERKPQMIYETPVSTIENPPKTTAWISASKFDQKRAVHLAQPPPRRSQASDPGLDQPMPAPSTKRLRLGPKSRVKQGRDFTRVRQGGDRAVTGCLIANWLRRPAESRSRLGVVVSRKVGGAVARSRARRLLREAFRVHQHELSAAVDLVLVARPSIAGRRLAEVEADFLKTLRKAELLSV